MGAAVDAALSIIGSAPDRRPPAEAWGTCVSVEGARASVLVDGDGEPVDLPMESGAAGMAPGDRCLVRAVGREASVWHYRLTDEEGG